MKKLILLLFIAFGVTACLQAPPEAKTTPPTDVPVIVNPCKDCTPPKIPIQYVNNSYFTLWSQVKSKVQEDGTPYGYFDFFVNNVRWASFLTINFYGQEYHIKNAHALHSGLLKQYNETGNPDAKKYAGEIEDKIVSFYEAAYNVFLVYDEEESLRVYGEKLTAGNQNFELVGTNIGLGHIGVNLLLDRNTSALRFDYTAGNLSIYSTTNQTAQMVMKIFEINDFGENAKIQVGVFEDGVLFKSSDVVTKRINGYIYPRRIEL